MRKLLSSILFLLIALTCEIEARIIPITIEHAVTPEERAWGLMGRESLPPSHGMLFHYPKPHVLSVWSFNCRMDLSVAFINSQGVIMEIQDLKAYPEKMDPARPVLSYEDLSKYPSNDLIIRFFKKNSITAKKPATYLLEMNINWFKDNHVNVGDSLVVQEGSRWVDYAPTSCKTRFGVCLGIKRYK